MKTQVGHLQYNIDPANAAFYKGLFEFLGWNSLHDDGGSIGVGNDGAVSLWFMGGTSGHANHHDGPGLNHLGLSAESVADVDATVAHLQRNGIELLFGTPCNRPEFTGSEDELYYSAMFISPDGILFEVVYTGPK